MPSPPPSFCYLAHGANKLTECETLRSDCRDDILLKWVGNLDSTQKAQSVKLCEKIGADKRFAGLYYVRLLRQYADNS